MININMIRNIKYFVILIGNNTLYLEDYTQFKKIVLFEMTEPDKDLVKITDRIICNTTGVIINCQHLQRMST